VEAAGYADERPFRLLELGNQSRSDAYHHSVLRTAISHTVLRYTKPAVDENRHPKTIAEAHIERLFSDRGVYFLGYASIRNSRKTVC
jgi:hypothetical protein